MYKRLLMPAVVAAAVAFASSAHATPIFNADYDANAFPNNYYYGYGGATVTGHAITAGAGVGGSNAYVLTWTPVGASAHGVGIGFNDIAPPAAAPLAASDVTYSLAIKLVGTMTGNVPLNLQFKYIAPDNTIQPPDADTNGDTLWFTKINISYDGLAGGFQTFTGNLGMGTDQGTATLAQVQALGTNNLTLVQLNVAGDWYNVAPLGTNPGTQMIVDNVVVNQATTMPIPEPASLGLLALGGLALLRRR